MFSDNGGPSASDNLRDAYKRITELEAKLAALSPPVAETPEVLAPSGYKSPMQRHYETPEFKAAWAAGKAERDAASPVVAPAPHDKTECSVCADGVSQCGEALRERFEARVASAPVVDEATHLLWTGLVRYLDEQFGLALRPEHCLMIKSMLVNRAQPIDAPRPDRSEPIAAPAPVVEKAMRYAIALMRDRLDVEAPFNAAIIREYIAALSPRETPDGGGRRPMTDDPGYRYGLPDDELLPLRRCKCGQEFELWGFCLGLEADDARECPACHRRLYWSAVITIHEAQP